MNEDDCREQPDARHQRRDAGERPADPGARGRLVPVAGDRGVARDGDRHRRRRRAARGVAEVELGTPLSEVIVAIGGGVRAGPATSRPCCPGVANPVLTAAAIDTPVAYESMAAVGSGLGACGFIVYDDTADMVGVALMVSRFLYVESCGQCPACKFGTGEVTAYLEHLAEGIGTERDIELIGARLETVTDANRCYLGTQEQLVIASFLRAFPEDFVGHLERRDPARSVPVPKLVDLADGVAVYDERQARSARLDLHQQLINFALSVRRSRERAGSFTRSSGGVHQSAGNEFQAGNIVSTTVNSERHGVAMSGASRPRCRSARMSRSSIRSARRGAPASRSPRPPRGAIWSAGSPTGMSSRSSSWPTRSALC